MQSRTPDTLADGDPRVTRINLLPAAVCLCLTSPLAAADRRVDYSRDIRPILAEHCWGCHGPDEKTREAGLRLDLRDSATGLLKSGHRAIVPGKAGESALVARI